MSPFSLSNLSRSSSILDVCKSCEMLMMPVQVYDGLSKIDHFLFGRQRVCGEIYSASPSISHGNATSEKYITNCALFRLYRRLFYL